MLKKSGIVLSFMAFPSQVKYFKIALFGDSPTCMAPTGFLFSSQLLEYQQGSYVDMAFFVLIGQWDSSFNKLNPKENGAFFLFWELSRAQAIDRRRLPFPVA